MTGQVNNPFSFILFNSENDILYGQSKRDIFHEKFTELKEGVFKEKRQLVGFSVLFYFFYFLLCFIPFF